MKSIFTPSHPIRKGLLILFVLFTSNLYAADYYWVGGGGNWSDLSHWRLGSSSGSVPSIVPSSSDNVFFGSYSGFGTTPTSKTMTLDANGYCNNMTWAGVLNNPIFVTGNASLTVEIWGSMVLSPGTTYTCLFKFKGATPANITTNGTVTGYFGMEIDKPGSSLAVTDSLVQATLADGATNVTSLVAGTYNIAGKKVTGVKFFSVNDNTRTLEMTNANVTYGYHYRVTGLNKTVNASGSVLNATGYLFIDYSVYNVVNNGAQDAGNFSIYNCTFTKLTFNHPSLSSQARIHDGNTVDTIRFIGSGSIGSNNNVNVILATGAVATGSNNIIDTIISSSSVSVINNNTITRVVSNGTAGGMGIGNTVGYWQHGGNFSVAPGGSNTVDSLLLTPGKIITFQGAFNVNRYLELNGIDCNAYSEVNGDSTSGSLNFAPGAAAVMNNMVLTGVKAYGPVTPLAVNGIDNGGNAGFTINEPSGVGTTYYWVGGPGDWNDKAHWSSASGGAGGACVPFKNDNVVFDANSGLATGTVTTSGSSFCNDMTWNGVGTVTFSESTTSLFRMYGSLVMDNSVTMNAILEFHGSNPATITTNGSGTGALQFIITKTDNAVVTLTDDWNNTTGGSIVYRSGGLNLSSRTVSLVLFSSSAGGAARILNISNATLSFTNYWDYRGVNKSLIATGSYLTSGGGFGSDGQNYPWVDITGTAGTGIGFPISGTTFGQLTYTNALTPTGIHAGSNNTIRRLEFKGNGSVGGNNIIDSLILAGSKSYSISNLTINKYLKAIATPCTGLTEMRGVGTISFAAGAVTDIANAYMQNITATGPITPVAFNGADAGGNSGWTINVAPGGARYWVGGGGDWNDPAHWSSTSGGTPGSACIPTVYDDVYFDVNSGFGTTAPAKTVTVNTGNAYARNINWTGAPNNPIWSKSASWNLEVWGDSLIMTSPATFSLSLTLKGSVPAFMKGGSPSGVFDVYIDKPGSSLTLLNDYSNTQGRFFLTNGAFNTTGRTLTFNTFTNSGLPNASSVDISNSTLTLNGSWNYSGTTTSHALNAANSSITTQAFNGTGFNYNRVNVNGGLSNSGTFNNTTIDSVVFTLSGISSQAGINGTGNQFNYVEYKGSGGIYGTNNTIDTLVFFPGSRYVLNSGTNTTITGAWYGSGTPCRLTEIVSSSTTNATITKISGDVSFDYVRLQRITGTGGATYNTQQHSIDLGSNANWTMAPYDGAAPIYGLGPDMSVPTSSFPIVLQTDGFFGNPSSQYTWNDNSTADTLLVTGPGTYNVNASFVDGCSIKDTIVITEATILPVTLISFIASLQNCETYLSWRTADAINFSHYVVEKSKDGVSFNSIGEVINVESVYRYSYTDKNTGSGNRFYRLRLMDQDGTYKYSPVVSVRSDCEERIKVYPTLTRNEVKIILPQQGYEKAQLYIMNITGQCIATAVHGSGSLRTVNLQGLPSSTYILQVVNGKETRSFKIVKQ